jgi:hypothetical protein
MQTIWWAIASIIFLIIGLGMIVTQHAGSPAVSEATVHSTQLATALKTFTLVVQNRKLIVGPHTLNVAQNDTVTIIITADEDEELHVHGYDLHIDLKKNTKASLSFVASSSGRFPFELERSKTDLGALEVQPK